MPEGYPTELEISQASSELAAVWVVRILSANEDDDYTEKLEETDLYNTLDDALNEDSETMHHSQEALKHLCHQLSEIKGTPDEINAFKKFLETLSTNQTHILNSLFVTFPEVPNAKISQAIRESIIADSTVGRVSEVVEED